MKWVYRGASQKIWILLCVVIGLWGHQRWSSEFRLVHCHVNWYGRDVQVSINISDQSSTFHITHCFQGHRLLGTAWVLPLHRICKLLLWCCIWAAVSNFTPLSWRCRRIINFGFGWTLYRFLGIRMSSILAFLMLFLKEFLHASLTTEVSPTWVGVKWSTTSIAIVLASRKASLHTPSLFCGEST